MSQRKAQHCGFTYPRGNRPSGTDQTSTQWRTLEAGTRAPTDSSPAVSSDGERLNLLLFSRLPRLDRLHFTTNSLRRAQTLRHRLTLLTLARRSRFGLRVRGEASSASAAATGLSSSRPLGGRRARRFWVRVEVGFASATLSDMPGVRRHVAGLRLNGLLLGLRGRRWSRGWWQQSSFDERRGFGPGQSRDVVTPRADTGFRCCFARRRGLGEARRVPPRTLDPRPQDGSVVDPPGRSRLAPNSWTIGRPLYLPPEATNMVVSKVARSAIAPARASPG